LKGKERIEKKKLPPPQGTKPAEAEALGCGSFNFDGVVESVGVIVEAEEIEATAVLVGVIEAVCEGGVIQ